MRRFLPVILVTLAAASPACAAGLGDTAPAFTLQTAAGDTVSLERLRGKVVYVDFWASWCGPCRRSFPWMNEMHGKYGSKGFAIVAVNVDKKRADAERFLSQVPAEFTVVYDMPGATPAAYAVKGMPSSYLIDAAGRIVAVEQGFRDERAAELEAQVRGMIGAK
jgi:cytochrome c biogenesis protein CcmG, thiol:disulfide interchange protein DsbE